MEIGIIGAGRAGGALAMALRNAGHRITAVADLVEERAATLAGRLGAAALPPAGAVAAAEVVLVSVPDDAIAAAAADLAPQVAACRGKIFLHLSGAHPARLLGPLAESGALGSLHPLLSLAEPESSMARLGRCLYALEGEPAAVAVAQELVRSLGAHFILLRPEEKVRYHAAAVMAANYLIGLIDVALGLYTSLGLARDTALAAIWPLVEATTANLGKLGPEAALTGPISRGDLATVREHLAELERIDPLATRIYRDLGRATLALAERAGRIDAGRAREIGEALGESGGEEEQRRRTGDP